jgi:putative sigma-54 modulation protein
LQRESGHAGWFESATVERPPWIARRSTVPTPDPNKTCQSGAHVMQIKLSGHHVEITQALHDYVHDKLERIERHFDNVTSAQVILSVDKLSQKAEATIHVAGNEIFADAIDEDMYAALDALIDKVDRQIKKHKEKLTDKHRGEKARSYPQP